MTDDEKIKGFVGLASLVSDIDEVLSHTQAKPTTTRAGGRADNRSEPTRREPTQAKSAKAASHTPPASNGAGVNAQKKSKSGTSPENWFWGLFGVGILIILFYAGTADEGGRSPARTTQPSFTTQSSDEPTRALSVEFSKPPAGENNVLSLGQLRWCLREGIRIDTLRPLTTTNAEVGRFNSIVSDYNSRCASFRYRQETLERATRDIEAMREDIVEAAYRNSAKVLGRIDGAANSQGESESEGGTLRPETAASTRQPSKTTTRGTDKQNRGCVYKRIMTEADYIDCGLIPPSAEDNPRPTGEGSEEVENSAQNTLDNVTERLRRCREHYDADRLTTGVGGTALECYQRVLAVDPGNADAIAGLTQIADKYVLWARTAFQRGQLKRSRTYLDRLERVNSNHPVLHELGEAVRASEKSEPDSSEVAKIYYFRSYGSAGRLRKYEFSAGGRTVGQLGVRQYLYFYTYPQAIRGPDDCQVNAQAGETYYFQFHLAVDLSDWRCELLNLREAKALLDSFSESEDFAPITMGAR